MASEATHTLFEARLGDVNQIWIQLVAEDLHSGFVVTSVGPGQSCKLRGSTSRGRRELVAAKDDDEVPLTTGCSV